MKRLALVAVGVALTAGGFGLGLAAQHAHDQAMVSRLVHDNGQLTSERQQLISARQTAELEAQESAEQATEARDRAANASNDNAAKVKAADDAGFIRGFCEVAFVVGTDKATLGQVVHSIDDDLWSACEDGIRVALQVVPGPGVTPTPAPSGPVWQPSVPSAPLSAYGGILCVDGTVSHAAHRQGACSWHGGISP